MKLTVIGAAIVMMLTGSAFASEEMAKEYSCFGCHSIKNDEVHKSLEKKGPAFEEVSKKYQGKEDALSLLVQSIMEGSQEKWHKEINMVPRSKVGKCVNKECATDLAKWILTLAK
jgi:cytochrome c551/c552